MANFTCLAAARDHVLRETGWDVETAGLQGAPKVTVVVKSDRHSTIARALRYLGLGDSCAVAVDSDEQARIDPEALERTLRSIDGPTIVVSRIGQHQHRFVRPIRAGRRPRPRPPRAWQPNLGTRRRRHRALGAGIARPQAPHRGSGSRCRIGLRTRTTSPARLPACSVTPRSRRRLRRRSTTDRVARRVRTCERTAESALMTGQDTDRPIGPSGRGRAPAEWAANVAIWRK